MQNSATQSVRCFFLKRYFVALEIYDIMGKDFQSYASKKPKFAENAVKALTVHTAAVANTFKHIQLRIRCVKCEIPIFGRFTIDLNDFGFVSTATFSSGWK